MAKFTILFRHSTEETNEDHKNLRQQAVSGTRFEPETPMNM
jgi:hypothetical protein